MSKDGPKELSEEEKKNVSALKSLSQFTKVLKSILIIYSSNNKQQNSDGGPSKFIKKYEKQLIEKKGIDFKTCHAPLFRKMYFENRQHFLDICEDSNFIKDAKLKIWFGEDKEVIKKKNLRLPIYICYEKAKEMHDEASEKINGEDDDEDARIVESPEYTMYFELMYYLLDCICLSLEYSGETVDLKSLRKSLKDLREDAGVDENNEVAGSSLMNVVRNVTKLVTGKDEEIDERQIEGAIAKAGEMFSNPELTEAAGDLINEMKETKMERKEGQSVTQFMSDTLQRLGPILDKVVPTGGEEEVPEGVTVEQKTSPVKPERKNLEVKEDEIEIIKKK